MCFRQLYFNQFDKLINLRFSLFCPECKTNFLVSENIIAKPVECQSCGLNIYLCKSDEYKKEVSTETQVMNDISSNESKKESKKTNSFDDNINHSIAEDTLQLKMAIIKTLEKRSKHSYKIQSIPKEVLKYAKVAIARKEEKDL